MPIRTKYVIQATGKPSVFVISLKLPSILLMDDEMVLKPGKKWTYFRGPVFSINIKM